jgi:hypothetical protein
MAKRKLTPIVTPNTLEAMIEYTLISSVRDKMCDMTKKPLEYPKNDTQLVPPPRHLIKTKTWGIDWKNAIDKINEWMEWIWTMLKETKKVLHYLNKL